MLETFLRNELHPRQQDLLWFQQDGATTHTAEIVIEGGQSSNFQSGYRKYRLYNLTGQQGHYITRQRVQAF